MSDRTKSSITDRDVAPEGASSPVSHLPPGNRSSGGTQPSPQPDHSKTMAAVWIPIIVGVAGLFGGAISWTYSAYREHQTEVNTAKAQNEQLVNDLIKMRLKLTEAKNIHDQLTKDYLEPISKSKNA